MILSKGLRDYLVDTTPVTGYPATAFRDPQTVGDLTITDRDEARRYLRARVGNEIYASRRPREGSQHTAVTLRRIATNRVDEVGGGTPLADAIIQVDVWTRGPEAALRGEITAILIRLACEGFGAGTWGGVTIADCEVAREAEFVETPKQGDDWTHRYSMDLRVHYYQASAVV